jgi:hypothetical protein
MKENLPLMGVLKKLDPEFTEGHIDQKNIDGNLDYFSLLSAVA